MKHVEYPSKEPEYINWMAIHCRCYNKLWHRYDRYGGRGITVCKRWFSFENFLKDMGLKPSPRHTVERKDNNKEYCPDNCVWATRKQQARNRSSNVFITAFGMTKTIVEWSEMYGIKRQTISLRIKKGVHPEVAVKVPPCKVRRKDILFTFVSESPAISPPQPN